MAMMLFGDGEAGENPAQSYLYCKRGRRRGSHWPSGREGAPKDDAQARTSAGKMRPGLRWSPGPTADTCALPTTVGRAFFLERGPTMAGFEHYISVGKERLRCGYTTGTCAAAAARGAAERLLTGCWAEKCAWRRPPASRCVWSWRTVPPGRTGPPAPCGRTAGTTRTPLTAPWFLPGWSARRRRAFHRRRGRSGPGHPAGTGSAPGGCGHQLHTPADDRNAAPGSHGCRRDRRRAEGDDLRAGGRTDRQTHLQSPVGH